MENLNYENFSEAVKIQNIVGGHILKIEKADDAFICIQEKNGLYLLLRSDTSGISPIDFDVCDFSINKKEKRIEYFYARGTKAKISINYDGSDKKQIC